MNRREIFCCGILSFLGVDKGIATEKIKRYILLMLGAPIVAIELDNQQLDMCITETQSDMTDHKNIALLKFGALARAKIILGRIRSKFQEVPGPYGSIKLNGTLLINEGRQELENFHKKISCL